MRNELDSNRLFVLSVPVNQKVFVVPKAVVEGFMGEVKLTSSDYFVGNTPLEVDLQPGDYYVTVQLIEPFDFRQDTETARLDVLMPQGLVPSAKVYTLEKRADHAAIVTALFWPSGQTLAEFVDTLPDQERFDLINEQSFETVFDELGIPPEDWGPLKTMLRRTGKANWFSLDGTGHAYVYFAEPDLIASGPVDLGLQLLVTPIPPTPTTMPTTTPAVNTSSEQPAASSGTRVITAENITRLERLPTSEPGPLYDIALTEDGETLVAIARDGLALYSTADLTPLNFVPYKQTPFASCCPYFNNVDSPLGAVIQGTTVSFEYDDQQWFIDISTGDVRSEPAAPADYEYTDTPTTSPDGQWEITFERDPISFKPIYTAHNVTTDAQYDVTLAVCGGGYHGFAAVFHPDSTRLYTAAGSHNGTIIAWDLMTGKTIAVRGGFSPEIHDMVLLPDTNTLLVVQGELKVPVQAMYCPGERNPNTGVFAYDLASGASSPLDLPGVLYPYQIAASADGRVLLVTDWNALTLWENGEQVARHEYDIAAFQPSLHPARYLDYALSPDGQYIAALSWEEVIIWDYEALVNETVPISTRLRFEFEDSRLWGSLYDPLKVQGLMTFDGSRLMVADINTVHVFDAASGEAQADLELPPLVTSVAVAGRTLAVQTAWGDFLAMLTANLSASGETVSEELMDELRERYGLTDVAPAVKVFRLGDGSPSPLGEIEVSTQDWLALNPDASLVVTKGDDQEGRPGIRFYDASTGALLHSIGMQVLLAPVFSADGTLLVIPSDWPGCGLQIWGIREN
jgi:WD40 repeat protein